MRAVRIDCLVLACVATAVTFAVAGVEGSRIPRRLIEKSREKLATLHQQETHSHHSHHSCVHDEIMASIGHEEHHVKTSSFQSYEKAHPDTQELRPVQFQVGNRTIIGPNARKLQSSLQPLRILVDGRALDGVGEGNLYCPSDGAQYLPTLSTTSTARNRCKAEDVLTNVKKTFLRDTILVEALQWFSDTLSVTPVQGNLILDRPMSDFSCFRDGTIYYSFVCCESLMPSEYETTGASNADFVLHVTARPTGGSTIAWALTCQSDQNGRPVSGHANFAPSRISTAPEDYDLQLSTAVHEIAHALGFSSSKFSSFRKPGTTRQESYSNIIRNFNELGKTGIKKIVTANVVAKSKEHYGCDAWANAGAALEDFGGSGTAGSHWEKRDFDNEFMTGTADPNSVYSAISIALFQDSGWYGVSYQRAQTLFWGRGEGCSFVTQRCSDGWSDRYFCTVQDQAGCTVDLRYQARCNLVRYPFDVDHQYFSDPTLGGSDQYKDMCPHYARLSSGDCQDPNTRSLWYFGEFPSSQSRCFTGTYQRSSVTRTPSLHSGCLQATCSLQTNLLEVTLQGSFGSQLTVTCPKDGGQVSLGDLSGSQFIGNLDCPPASVLCTGDPCDVNDCQGSGTCQEDGTCVCNAGFFGSSAYSCDLQECPTGLAVSGNLTQCSGNGYCDTSTGQCLDEEGGSRGCFEGYKDSSPGAGDCALQGCAASSSPECSANTLLQVVGSGPNGAPVCECSARGTCDDSRGVCECTAGFTGFDCSRRDCPGTPACSGTAQGICDSQNGVCVCAERSDLVTGADLHYSGANCSLAVEGRVGFAFLGYVGEDAPLEFLSNTSDAGTGNNATNSDGQCGGDTGSARRRALSLQERLGIEMSLNSGIASDSIGYESYDSTSSGTARRLQDTQTTGGSASIVRVTSAAEVNADGQWLAWSGTLQRQEYQYFAFELPSLEYAVVLRLTVIGAPPGYNPSVQPPELVASYATDGRPGLARTSFSPAGPRFTATRNGTTTVNGIAGTQYFTEMRLDPSQSSGEAALSSVGTMLAAAVAPESLQVEISLIRDPCSTIECAFGVPCVDGACKCNFVSDTDPSPGLSSVSYGWRGGITCAAVDCPGRPDCGGASRGTCVWPELDGYDASLPAQQNPNFIVRSDEEGSTYVSPRPRCDCQEGFKGIACGEYDIRGNATVPGQIGSASSGNPVSRAAASRTGRAIITVDDGSVPRHSSLGFPSFTVARDNVTFVTRSQVTQLIEAGNSTGSGAEASTGRAETIEVVRPGNVIRNGLSFTTGISMEVGAQETVMLLDRRRLKELFRLHSLSFPLSEPISLYARLEPLPGSAGLRANADEGTPDPLLLVRRDGQPQVGGSDTLRDRRAWAAGQQVHEIVASFERVVPSEDEDNDCTTANQLVFVDVANGRYAGARLEARLTVQVSIGACPPDLFSCSGHGIGGEGSLCRRQCECQFGYEGVRCEVETPPLQSGDVAFAGPIEAGQWRYFIHRLAVSTRQVRLDLLRASAFARSVGSHQARPLVVASFEQSRLSRPLARLSGELAMYDYQGYRRALQGEQAAAVSFAQINRTDDSMQAASMLRNRLLGDLQESLLRSSSGAESIEAPVNVTRQSAVGWDILGVPTSAAIAPVGHHRQTLLLSRSDPTAQFLVIGVHNAREARADAAVDLALLAISDRSFDLAAAAQNQANRIAQRAATADPTASRRRTQAGSAVDLAGTSLAAVDNLCNQLEEAQNATSSAVDGSASALDAASPMQRSPAVDFCVARECGGSGTLVNSSGSLQCQCLPGWGSDDSLCSSPRFRDFSKLVQAAQGLDFLCSICNQKQFMNAGDMVLVKVQQPLQNGRALRLDVGHPLDVNLTTNASELRCQDTPQSLGSSASSGVGTDDGGAPVVGLPGAGGGSQGQASDLFTVRAVPALLVATVLPRQVADFATIQASAGSEASLLVTERSETGSYWAAVYAQSAGCVQLVASREELESSDFPESNFWADLGDWLFGTRPGMIVLIVVGSIVALISLGCIFQNCITTHHDPHVKMQKHAARTRQHLMTQFASMRNMEIAASRRHIALPTAGAMGRPEHDGQVAAAGAGSPMRKPPRLGHAHTEGGSDNKIIKTGSGQVKIQTADGHVANLSSAPSFGSLSSPVGQSSVRSIQIPNPLHSGGMVSTGPGVPLGTGQPDQGVFGGVTQAIRGTMLGQVVTEEGVREYQHNEAVQTRNVAKRLLRRGASMRKVGNHAVPQARGDAYGYGYGGQAVPLQGQGSKGAAPPGVRPGQSSEGAAAAAMASMHGARPSSAGRRLQLGGGRKGGGMSLGDVSSEDKVSAGAVTPYGDTVPVRKGIWSMSLAKSASLGAPPQ